MTITWRGPLLVFSLVAVLVFAGCGGGDDDSSTGSASATQAASTVDSGSATTEDTAEDSGDDSGGGGDFCEELKSIGEDLQDQSASSDPAALGEAFSHLADALKSVDPPSELSDQWATLTDLYSTFAKVFANADFSDPESLAGLQDDLQQFQDKQDEIADATTAMAKYAADNCGGAF